MSKLRTTLLLALPLVAAGTLWFGRETQPASAAEPILPAASTLVAPGRVEPVRDPVALAFEAGGRVVAIEVDEGTAVTAGQVVARLDDRLPRARLAAATAAVHSAEASYLLVRRGTRAEDLRAAKAELDAASAAAEHRTVEQQRSARLGEIGAIASSTVDNDDTAARVAAATATAAGARYQALAKGSRVEQISAAAAQLDAAKAELTAAEIALDHTILRAPRAGIVLRRFGEVGALVTPLEPSPIVTIADVGALEIRAEIDETDIAAVQLGKAAYATADAFPGQRFPVHISRVTRELGRKLVRDDNPRARVDTRVLEALATFDAVPGEQLPLGLRMYVHVER
jgi:multidrug resistance efflux pump